VLHKKVGDFVKEGETLAELHANDKGKAEIAAKRYLEACTISENPVEIKCLIKEILS